MKRGGEEEEGKGRGRGRGREAVSLPCHHRDERGEAGDMQIQNVQNGEEGGCKCKGLNNRVNCTENEKSALSLQKQWTNFLSELRAGKVKDG